MIKKICVNSKPIQLAVCTALSFFCAMMYLIYRSNSGKYPKVLSIVPNGKLTVFKCSNIKVHYNWAVMIPNCGTAKNS